MDWHCCRAAIRLPVSRINENILPPEGRSLVPVFQGRALDREALYWEHEGNRAIRVGDWKLVAKGRRGPWELYNVADDRSELENLAATHPERVDDMAAMWQAYAKRTRVLPYPAEKKKTQAKGTKDGKTVDRAGR